MRLTTKINIYIIFVCLVIILMVKYQTDKQKEFIDLYITKMVEQKESLFNIVSELRSEPYKRVLEENTLWDDMIKFIKVKDINWAAENINTMLDVHKANCVWIYDAEENVVHSIQNLDDSKLNKLPVSEKSLSILFKDTKFPHFFAVTKEGLMEIYGASIHPTNDFDRKTNPAGYFFVGILWDKKYESNIEQIIDCSIDIILPGIKDTISNNPSVRAFTKKIFNPANNTEIASIIVSKDISQLMNMEHIPKKTFGSIMIFFVVFVLVSAFTFWLWVAVPLKKISFALNSSDTSHLDKVVSEKSVFGDIAQTIIESFKQKKEIEESEKKFKDMFENHSAVMILVDPATGKIVDANKSSEEFYKYNHDTLINMNIGDIDIQSKEDLKVELTKSSKGEKNYFIYKHKLSDGKIRDVEVYSKPIRVNTKKVLFIIVHDITERKKAEEGLIEAKDEAEKAALMKAQFLSNMSHEIRTPLNAIIGLSNLMINEDDVDERKRENLKAIKFSADHLHAIINDILDFSKIEAGKVTLEKIDFNIRELIDNAAKTLELKAKEKNLNLKTYIEEDTPQILIGDPVRLNQIIINLVGNAVKFTETGGVEIKVEVNKKENSNISLNFKICDTGIGISQHRINKIFESFTQAYVDTTRKYGGTGLGLAITKRLVELQGGEVKVESTVGKGSVFSFIVTFGISDKQKIKDTEKILLHTGNLSGIKLLLAEDNVMNQFFAKQLFSKWEINVDVANNGLEAVGLLKKNDYDIVLLDLQMPEMNGFEVVEIIRDKNSEVRNHNIPVIALTADISPDTKEKVNSSGMNDFVLKPFEQHELYSKISKFIA
jgi:PAS domain S-box-containing protein